MNIKPYLNQNYEEIKRRCLSNGQLFVDDQFRADSTSLARFKQPEKTIYWKRPVDIVSRPQFFVNGPDPNDLDQGIIGDCWFIAGAIAVSQYPEYFDLVVPQGQSFDEGDYCGAFHFRFWRYGEWLDVVIDDFLPVDSYNRLAYCSNKTDPNEFWCSLLEKAYAKLNTCYEFLNEGQTQDALIDLTGGVEEVIEIEKINRFGHANFLWKFLLQAYKMKSLAGASLYRQRNPRSGQIEAFLPNGLVANHAYTITKVAELDTGYNNYSFISNYYTSSYEKVRLVRLRNPWGGKHEWNGKFSDKSPEWQRIPYSVKEELGVVLADDGEFWMPFEDFIANFQILTLVHVNMNAFYDSMNSFRQDAKWHTETFHGRMTAASYGGYNSFYSDPQYLVSLNQTDRDDYDNKATLFVSLLQKDSVKKRDESYGQYNEAPIYFSVYKLKTQRPLNQLMNKNVKFSPYDLEEIANTGSYIPLRSVTRRFKLPPGNYVIIPKKAYNDNVNFILRTFTEFDIQEKDLSLGQIPPEVDSNPEESYGYGENSNENANNTDYDYNNYGETDYNNYLENNNNNNTDNIDERYYDFDYSNYVDENSDYYKIDFGNRREYSKGNSSDEIKISDVDTDCSNSSTKDKCSVM